LSTETRIMDEDEDADPGNFADDADPELVGFDG
jgi:hypothetical protein